mmetsp:Transcript_92094/g.204439  ORF Transcript_92094/g.204439 Transcript_92094/m.204439 type:complete len:225 (+) Transcript_92094:66-740(+)
MQHYCRPGALYETDRRAVQPALEKRHRSSDEVGNQSTSASPAASSALRRDDHIIFVGHLDGGREFLRDMCFESSLESTLSARGLRCRCVAGPHSAAAVTASPGAPSPVTLRESRGRTLTSCCNWCLKRAPWLMLEAGIMLTGTPPGAGWTLMFIAPLRTTVLEERAPPPPPLGDPCKGTMPSTELSASRGMDWAARPRRARICAESCASRVASASSTVVALPPG